MTRKSITLSLACATLGVLAFAQVAQSQTMYGPSFGLSQPLSHTREFADDLSLRNLSGDLRVMLGGRTSLGALVGWHVFHEQEELQSAVPGTTATATGLQYRTVNAVPLMVSAHRYFGDALTRRFYIGAGAGATYTKTRLDVGILGSDADEWGFTVAPEIGYMRPFRGSAELLFSAKYLWTSGDLGAQALVFGFGIMSWPFLS
jgi:hypothetical protein